MPRQALNAATGEREQAVGHGGVFGYRLLRIEDARLTQFRADHLLPDRERSAVQPVE